MYMLVLIAYVCMFARQRSFNAQLQRKNIEKTYSLKVNE